MAWFRRQKDVGDDRAAETAVASDFAEFLAQATEGKALIQAIGDAHAHPDEPTVIATGRDARPRRDGDKRRPKL